MEKGQILELKIEDMSNEGAGIGKADGFAVFVKNTVVGDVVKAELTKVKKNYGFARVTKFVEESPWRVEPTCEHCDSCGGCTYGRLSYEAQLALKEKQVRDKICRLGGISSPDMEPIMGMDEPYRYRNKASMPVSTGGIITMKGGVVRPVHDPRIGFYQPKSHDVVDVQDCMLQSEPAMAAARALRQFMKEDNITSYDPRWEKGLMRHMVVRTAEGTGEVMVVLVINGKGIPNASKLVEMLDDAIYNVPVYEDGPLAGVEFNLESVVININKKNSSEILGEECITIAGKPTIMEEVGGLKFEISPLSFYQVNRQQMIKLYDKVIEYADLKGDETVLDLYCGVGTIGLFCAAEMNRLNEEAAASGADGSGAGRCGRVLGIETVKGAVTDANRNAVINEIVNARYVCGKAEVELPKLVKGDDLKDESLRITRADVVILDPPRAGCDEILLETVAEVAPEKIVYVSCDAATLARDIKFLSHRGYEFVKACPCDMFPWTNHVETVVLLSKGEVDSKKVRVEFSLDDMDMSDFQDSATYTQIKDYVLEHSGLKVSNLYISQIKRKCGIEVGKRYNLPKSEDSRQPQCPPEKEKAIREAFEYFGLI